MLATDQGDVPLTLTMALFRWQTSVTVVDLVCRNLPRIASGQRHANTSRQHRRC